MRILIVEDSNADALQVRRSIERNTEDPPTFARALDLGEGVRRCREEDFDVVLLDLHLPDATGAETVARFMKETPEPRPAVVVLTSEDDEAVRAETLRLGVDDYLVKGELGPRPVYRLLLQSSERHRSARSSPGERLARRLTDEVGAPLARLRERALGLAASADDAKRADALREVARDAERAAKALEALLRQTRREES